MQPDCKFLTLCKCFGLSAFSENQKIQQRLIVYSCCIALFLTIFYGYTLNLKIEDGGCILSSVVSNMVFASQILAHLVTLFESVLKRRSQAGIHSKIKEFDELYRIKFVHKVEHRDIRKRLLFKYFLTSTFIILSYLVNIYTAVMHFRLYGGFASIVTLRIRFIQEELYLDLINTRLEALQLKLKQIYYCKTDKKTRFLDVNYREIEHPDRIFALKAAYGKLHEAVECFNDSFGCSMLFSISSYFLDFTCNSYWLLLTLDGKRPKYMLWEYSTTLTQLWMQLSMLCWICDKCAESGTCIKKFVRRMLTNLMHEHSKETQEEFLLHVSLRPIVIHAKYFFNINLTLLGAIFSSVISSLVILIQFLVIEDGDVDGNLRKSNTCKINKN